MMRRTFLALLLLLAALPASAAIVATCDPLDPVVPGRLLSVAIRPVDAAELSDPARIVWESPPRAGARDISEWDERGQVYLALGRMPGSTDKCDAGQIVAMTQGELDAIAAAEQAASQAATREGAKAEYDSQLLLRVVVELLADEINILRQREGLQPRTAEQIRTALRTRLDAAQVAAQGGGAVRTRDP